MPQLINLPEPTNRQTYPGEIIVALNGARISNDQAWMPYSFQIMVQYFTPSRFEGPESQGFSEVGISACSSLAYDKAEPYVVNFGDLTSRPRPVDDILVRQHYSCLGDLFGAAIAEELRSIMLGLLEQFDPDQGSVRQFFRFADMAEFNSVFLNLCSIIAEHEEAEFDPRARLQALLDFWSQIDGKVNVPAQLRWYIENRPAEPGIDQGEYDAEATEFVELVAAGSRATQAALSTV